MNPLFTAAVRIQRFCDGQGWHSCIGLAAMPFEERCIARASGYDIAPDTAIRTCGAEDLVVLKAFADRPQDWIDIAGIATRQRRRLDRPLIWSELLPLLELKADSTTETRLRRLLGEPGDEPGRR